MFQCIIQQRTGWTHPEVRDVFSDVRQQLNEQLRCLDLRIETQVAIVQELQDYFRRRAEVELEYSKSLDKLGKSIQQRHKEQKQKRDQWPLYSSFSCWQQLVTQTKNLSRDHGVLSEIYSTHLVTRLQTVIEDCTRIYRKCREIAFETHEEILRILQELHTTMKTYQSYQSESKAAEAKLRTAELQRLKLQQSIPKEKLERSKKYKIFEKEKEKRKNKYTDAKLKALKAKNEYQLCLEASNNTIHKYFVDDLSDLIDCMDLGFHAVVSKALLMHVTGDQGRGRAVCASAETLSHTIHAMDSLSDKQKFLEQHHGAFMIPKRFEFQNGGNTTPAVQSVQTSADEELAVFHSIEPELQKGLHLEMEGRLRQLEDRVANLRTESDEIWKTLETAEINLLEFLNAKDFDCTSNFGNGAGLSEPCEMAMLKQKANKQEIEDFYVAKIREFILGTSRISRLDAKADFLRDQLSKDNAETTLVLAKTKPMKRKRIGRRNMTGQPKLFGGSLEEYIEATRDDIPLIIRSCVRVINLFGLHHQGIFRVSGSQIEITNFREAFEKGEDPLADTTDASDINSVAGVLKLYLRELREPLFPIIYFDHFVSLAQIESKHELINGIRKFLLTLPRSALIVIRYLFAFLNHLSEYSDENMMDAYNLAICFGPTLMPAPDDKDQVQYQNQVNDLIKNMILHHDELFPADLSGLQYEKYITREPYLDIDVGDSPSNDNIIEDPDSEIYPSEDEADSLVATAQYDFNARSNRELSIRKGDAVLLRKQVSTDWWMGSVNGKEGLVPDKYISLRIKGEDRDNIRSSSSEESVRKEVPPGVAGPVTTTRLDSVTEGLSTAGGVKSAVNKEVVIGSSVVSGRGCGGVGKQTTITTAIISSSSSSSTTSGASSMPSMTNSGGGSVPGGGAYGYHHNSNNNSHDDDDEESSAFEKSMDSLENMNPLQYEANPSKNGSSTILNRAEPIYAEPTKCPRVMTPVMLRAKSGTVGVGNRAGCIGSDDDEIVAGHHGAMETSTPNRHTLASSGSTTVAVVPNKHNSHNNRMFNNNGPQSMMAIDVNSGSSSSSIQARRYHSKSLSLSEGKTLAKAFESGGTNAPSLRLCTFSGSSQSFQQNRSMWEKRTEPEGISSNGSLTGSTTVGSAGDRNSRNAAPDLVLDLPAASSSSSSNSSSSGSLTMTEVPIAAATATTEIIGSSSEDVVDHHNNFHHHQQQPGSPDAEESGGGVGVNNSGADCFAHNQFTLKKNDKFMLESSRHTFSMDNNVAKEQQQSDVPHAKSRSSSSSGSGKEAPASNLLPTTSSSVLHISEEEEQNLSSAAAVAGETVIAERNTHKFITQFADLKLTGGSLPMMPGGKASSGGQVGLESSGSGGAEIMIPFKPILRRDKPQILRKPVLGSSASGPSSLVGSAGGVMTSFSAKGSSNNSSDGEMGGAKSLE